MRRMEAEQILARARTRRTLFHYFKDRYALVLLSLAAGDGAGLSGLREGELGRLFRKPIVADLYGRGRPVAVEDLKSVWPQQRECYLLSLDVWGDERRGPRSWYQTSRRGSNLVLQLNYSAKHDGAYSRLIRPVQTHPFVMNGHPVRERGRYTMSWSRIDLSLEHGEALIEEIQNDWLRMASYSLAAVRSAQDDRERERFLARYFLDASCTADALQEYVEGELAFHRRYWAEATLTAAVWFLREDLGIRNIYFHTHETGCRLKGISYRRPPVSLYEHLPRKFCFQRVRRLPRFLQTARGRYMRRERRVGASEFWYMRL